MTDQILLQTGCSDFSDASRRFHLSRPFRVQELRGLRSFLDAKRLKRRLHPVRVQEGGAAKRRLKQRRRLR